MTRTITRGTAVLRPLVVAFPGRRLILALLLPLRYTELYTSGTMEVAFQNLGLDPQKLLNDLVEVYSASIALNMPFDPNAVPIKTVKDLLEALYMRKKSIRQDQLFRLQTEITRLQAKA